MVKNYLKIAFRVIKHQFSYSALNILGLAIGLTCATYIYVYIQHEVSYDRFHHRAEHIYRADFTISVEGQEVTIAVAPTALLPAVEREFPEVISGVRLFKNSNPFILQRGNRVFQESNFFFADSTFNRIFNFPLSHGNPKTALVNPNSVVLARPMARKYFGSENPIGKTIRVNNSREYTVTGIFEDLPSNTHLEFDFVASFSSIHSSQNDSWRNANYPTYLLLQESADAATVEAKLAGLVDNIFGDAPQKPGFELTALTDIHLYSDVRGEYKPQSDILYIYIFSTIGMLILGIASINYMNLATARSTQRAREVGIRKVLGAQRSQVKKQFFGESVLNTLFALVFTLILLGLLLPVFNKLAGINFSTGDLYHTNVLAFLGVTSLIVSICSGLYPSFMLSRFEPATVLKGSFKSSGKGRTLRRVLVVTQFAVSAALILATIGIRNQLNYFQSKSLGYDAEQVFAINIFNRDVADRFSALESEFLQQSGVSNITMSSSNPTNIEAGYSIQIEGVDIASDYPLRAATAYPGFIETLGMELVAGRAFTESDLRGIETDQAEDRRYAFILNENAIRTFNLSAQEALGRRVTMNGRVGTVVGIVKDFHFSSLRENIGPLVLFVEQSYNKILVRVQTGNTQQTMSALGESWASIFPGLPFEYRFLDQEYNALYRFEQRIGELFSVFAVIALVVACLGLFGLASYMAVQRKREMSIRKVLGASVSNLIVLTTGDIFKLIVLSAVVGLPVAYWALDSWLNNFAYRIDINWQMILISIGVVFVIALLTVSYQALKAATVNPVENLSEE